MENANIQQLAAKTFGAVCYAGFDRVLWAVEDEHGLARGTLTTRDLLMKYRGLILYKVWVKIPDLEEAAQVIELVTGGLIEFSEDELVVYQDYIDYLIP